MIISITMRRKSVQKPTNTPEPRGLAVYFSLADPWICLRSRLGQLPRDIHN